MINYRKQEQAETFLTSVQAAKILNLSLSTLKKLIYQGQIKALKTPGGHYRICKSDLLSLPEAELKVDKNPDEGGKSFEIARSLVSDLEKKQRFCHGHSRSVVNLSEKIAKKLHFSSKRIEKLKLAAFLHDIGMIGIDANILTRLNPLNEKEYSIVKTHPLIGSEMAESLSQLKGSSTIIEQHHEWVNGTGYPLGLKEENICLEAKIIAVAEAFDCLTAKNSYKDFLSQEDAVEKIKAGSNKQFDSQVVAAFLEVRRSEQ